MTEPTSGAQSDPFPQTRWSLILTAQQGEEDQAQKALSELFSLYWFPVYGYVRRRGNDQHDAEDLTQAFFEKMIQREGFARASAGEGKLRGFLLNALKNFLTDQHRAKHAAKRGGYATVISCELAEARYESALYDHASPDVLFEKAWAHTVLEEVQERTRASYERAGKGKVFTAFAPHLLDGDGSPPYRELAKDLGSTPLALRVQFHRLRTTFRELLETEIRHTVRNAEDTKDELGYLIEVLKR